MKLHSVKQHSSKLHGLRFDLILIHKMLEKTLPKLLYLSNTTPQMVACLCEASYAAIIMKVNFEKQNDSFFPKVGCRILIHASHD